MTSARRRLAGIALGALLVTAGCAATDTTIATTGRVEVTESIVTAPALQAPAFDPDPDTPRPPPPAPPAQVPAVRVATVEVALGQRVTPGQLLLRLDAGPLTAQVAVARAGRAAAAAQVTLLTTTIGDLTTNRTTVIEARGKVDSAIATLISNRRQAASQLAAARRRLAELPEDPPPPQQPTVAQARARLQAAITQLTTAIGRLDAGLAQARAQRRQLDSARTRLTDAIKQVTDVRELARTAVTAAGISLQLARAAEQEATITAPAAGVITRLPTVGQVLAPGAALVGIAEAATHVTAWLPPAQAARLCPGDAADITADWLGDAARATVTLISPTAEFPPTHQSTGETHLTRAIRVEVTTRAGLPPGAPVDIHITPCRTS